MIQEYKLLASCMEVSAVEFGNLILGGSKLRPPQHKLLGMFDELIHKLALLRQLITGQFLCLLVLFASLGTISAVVLFRLFLDNLCCDNDLCLLFGIVYLIQDVQQISVMSVAVDADLSLIHI